MNNTTLNINNLTHLWKVAGHAFQGFNEGADYTISKIKNTEWPNRIWTNKPLTQTIVKGIGNEIENDPNLTFSYFNKSKEKNPLISKDTFTLKSVQHGMSSPITGMLKARREMDFKRVIDSTDAASWSTAFFQAFQYQIATETILNTKENIPYFLVHHQNELVGTVVLFTTNDVLGIHSLGIIPSQRQNGFAKDIMHHILNKVVGQNISLVTLQASEMARSMYLKMGFTTDFLMENYTLKT